ncbi:MAG: HAD family phosphatase [Clostridia bacterium]|nr:HAD family phosphatase [Clostridia bacterium]
MIKNVIFDFGQVIVHFEPSYMVRKYVSDEDDAKLLEEVVFDRLYWDELDLGTVSDGQVLEKIKERVPERLWEMCDTVYYNWVYNIPVIDGMDELVRYIKEKYGIRVFLLSNISKYFVSHKDEIPVLKEFEYCVFSSLLGIVKPDFRIFDYLCKNGGIKPEETIFVDDNPNNTKGAVEFGLNAYLFDGSSAKLKEYFDSIFS